ncbi:MAG: hypothetical protein Q9183_002608, partial [Haloplaca sp. 2 TL-2023]
MSSIPIYLDLTIAPPSILARIRDFNAAHDANGPYDCGICQNTLSGLEDATGRYLGMMGLPCGHRFHAFCIQEWLSPIQAAPIQDEASSTGPSTATTAPVPIANNLARSQLRDASDASPGERSVLENLAATRLRVFNRLDDLNRWLEAPASPRPEGEDDTLEEGEIEESESSTPPYVPTAPALIANNLPFQGNTSQNNYQMLQHLRARRTRVEDLLEFLRTPRGGVQPVEPPADAVVRHYRTWVAENDLAAVARATEAVEADIAGEEANGNEAQPFPAQEDPYEGLPAFRRAASLEDLPAFIRRPAPLEDNQDRDAEDAENQDDIDTEIL